MILADRQLSIETFRIEVLFFGKGRIPQAPDWDSVGIFSVFSKIYHPLPIPAISSENRCVA